MVGLNANCFMKVNSEEHTQKKNTPTSENMVRQCKVERMYVVRICKDNKNTFKIVMKNICFKNNRKVKLAKNRNVVTE